MNNQVKYRFAIMLNGAYMFPWQWKAYEALLATGLAEHVVFIIRQEQPGTEKNKGIFNKIFHPHFLFEQYKKRILHKDIYVPVALPADASLLKITPVKKGKYRETIADEDLEKIKNFRPDFMLRFGFGILDGAILHAAPLGIWSFHHGDEQEFRGGPAGFWEIFKGKKRQGVMLQQLTEKLDAGKILDKRYYKVLAHSYHDHLKNILEASADMPAKVLKSIHASGNNISGIAPVHTTAPVYVYPGPVDFSIFMWRVFFNKLRLKYQLVFKKEKWTIGWKKKTDDAYRFLPPAGKGAYYADPFIFKHGEEVFVVAEHYTYKEKKGTIRLFSLDDQLEVVSVKTVLSAPYHLAYPYIFKEGEHIYMLPESADHNRLDLYRRETEHSFQYVHTLLDIPAVDASLLKHEGKYYIFTGIKGALPNEKLFIFYADALEGPYLPHPMNPVKCSPEGARMGGNFFTENRQLFRPSQYSLNHYGEKIQVNKILELSPLTYRETFSHFIVPDKQAPYSDGLHNYSTFDELVIIDLKKMQSDIHSVFS